MVEPYLKPEPKLKKVRKPLRRSTFNPKSSGRRAEKVFADRYGFKRQIGSGAFGKLDPMLVGDIIGDIGRLKFLFENKSFEQYNSRGERTVTFPRAWLEKINLEAKSIGRLPMFIYHFKNSNEDWAVIRFDALYALLLEQENQIAALESQLEECLKS